MIRTIEWTDEGVVMIDQRLLPSEEIYNTYTNIDGVADAILSMVIRGAPAIGVATAMGIALEMGHLTSDDNLDTEFADICRRINVRPTARNLAWAIEQMTEVYERNRNRTLAELQDALKNKAIEMHSEDIEINRRMGQWGQQLLEDNCTVLTHCNAGALATAGYGTALGVIRAAVENGKAVAVFADETRPFLQGARLTAWEMVKEKIPCTLITDNMAGYFMRQGAINAVVVGADRIARNGDIANKIGTYTVAVLAREHDIPFYCAAPLSTIDRNTPTGDQIPIEQRDIREVTEVGNRTLAPANVKVANPAFDITPNELVTAIITEQGIARAPLEESIAELFETAGALK